MMASPPFGFRVALAFLGDTGFGAAFGATTFGAAAFATAAFGPALGVAAFGAVRFGVRVRPGVASSRRT
jgi:hypothetical protein